eukprot:XP_028334593.1 uncharacterized protein LOC114484204 [Physeter catodon]
MSSQGGHGSDLWRSGGSSGFFIPGFPKLLRLQAHEEHILGRALPQQRRNLQHEGQVSTGTYTTQWFLQCFIDRTPFSLTLKLRDAYILESKHVLTATVCAVLKVPERRVQAAEEAGRPAQEPRGRPLERALGSSPAHGSPGHSRPPGVVPSGTQPPPTGGAPGWGAESSRRGPRWPDGIRTPRTPPEAAPGRPAAVPAGHAVPGLGPGGRRGAQSAAGLDGRATQAEAGPASRSKT